MSSIKYGQCSSNFKFQDTAYQLHLSFKNTNVRKKVQLMFKPMCYICADIQAFELLVYLPLNVLLWTSLFATKHVGVDCSI